MTGVQTCALPIYQREEQICINDTDEMVDYEVVTEELRKCFDKILPDKSSFEK